jgi:serine-type D-Ala-D-Ala carboxypeptidase (penicillin-binding protein 5/6)
METHDDKRFSRRWVSAALLGVLALGLLAPAAAGAAPRSSDMVDGTSAAKRHLDLDALPDVSMAEGALFDGEGRMLWARSPGVRRPMASITKIMTAVVVLEQSNADEVVTVPRAAIVVGQSSANLVAGEKLTIRELLEALLVKSGNDASVALAIHVGGSEEAFVAMMNKKARDLGLTDTHFANPHGLDARGHYTTANDLGVLARYAMSKPAFRDIVRRQNITIGKGKHRETLSTTDQLLKTYQGAMGIKTGNTDGAGYSVVSAARRGGVTLYAIVLGTKTDRERFAQAKALLDWGFAHYRPMALGTKGTVVAEAPVSSYLDVTVPVAFSVDTTVAVLDLNGGVKRSITVAPVPAPVEQGQHVGVATYRQGGNVIATIPLDATTRVGRPNPLEAAWIALVRLWHRIFG